MNSLLTSFTYSSTLRTLHYYVIAACVAAMRYSNCPDPWCKLSQYEYECVLIDTSCNFLHLPHSHSHSL